MPRPRFAKLPPERQAQVLEKAAEEFAAHGYAHASLNHIIAALGLNKGVFYYYFDGKADLFGAVLARIWDAVLPPGELVIERLDAATFWPSVEQLIRRSHALIGSKPWAVGLARLFFEPQPEGAAQATRDLMLRGHSWAATLLLHGQRLGVVRMDVPLDYLLQVLTAADSASDKWLFANWNQMTAAERDQVHVRTVGLWRRLSEPRSSGPEVGS